ncbi:hypothetical protein OEA41_001455 [Lepraria neglecta]|uniref:P-loop containing nucleoside triphosphate hydrolase protein n=1 Tax=Lepraria neglecta TaxID=209136 RepID=A0AAE0DLI8_9LECA|nr:hypothetical protein OEA41_001455 [Lepraria neglecta]
MSESNSSTLESARSDEYEESDTDEVLIRDMKLLNVRPARPNRRFAVPSSVKAKMASTTWDTDLDHHNTFFATDGSNAADKANNVHLEEIRTTPLFSAGVLANIPKRKAEPGKAPADVLPQYGLLAKVLSTYDGKKDEDVDDFLGPTPSNLVNAFGEPIEVEGPKPVKKPEDKRLFVNMNAPWSAFICGSQGSGKSHTLSCMLENALISSRLGKLPHRLAGMVFHYDKFTGFSSTQICEAAYLSSCDIPVKILVSPSNLWRMQRAYESLPGFPKDAKKPVVVPLLLHEKQLNVERMMKLMAVDEKDGKMALYMESVCRILRSMAMKSQNASGINFADFTRRLELENFNDSQNAMLKTRLELLKSFMYLPGTAGTANAPLKKPDFADTKKGRETERKWYMEEDRRQRAQIAKSGIWSFEPGSLTIVDLSCPFVDESAACAMFNICLALFLEDRQKAGRIVALDEAHKFMTATSSSSQFTESLLSVIRQQRHLATRIIIATQEPTISPALLDLSSMTIVHRFTSPSWLTALKSHLAGVSIEREVSKRDVAKIFKQIVNLEAGEALLFSPSAMTGPDKDAGLEDLKMQKLGLGYVKVRVRQRLTADGGRSILAA